MLVAVLTPYFNEPLEVLARCHRSVREQTHADTLHIMVADGHPRPEVDAWDVLHLRLPGSRDYGDTPRAVAALIAANQGAEAVTLLDADNYLERDHIERLLELQRATGVQVVTTTRMLIRTDGTRLGVCHESNGKTFNDTNCYLVMKPAFALFSHWGFKDPRESITGDRVFWKAVERSGFARAHCEMPTVNYVTAWVHHYQQRGEPPPADAKVIVRFSGEDHDRLIPYRDYLAHSQQQQPSPAAPLSQPVRPPMTQKQEVPLEELKQYKLLIGTPMYGGACSGHYANASIRLAMQLQAAGISFGFAFVFNESLITRARNNIAASFMSSPVGYTHLMFIDADIDYSAGDVLAALAVQHVHRDDKNIVCAAYPRKRIAWDNIRRAVRQGVADGDPSLLENYVGDFVVGLDEGRAPAILPDLLQVTTAGTGFMLITRRVFEDFNARHPELKYRPDEAHGPALDPSGEVMCYFDAGIDPDTRTYVSEDYWFLKKARAMGHSTWLVPWINLGHVGSYRFSGNLLAVHSMGTTPA